MISLVSMTWRDVLFAHWPVDPAVVNRRLPPGLRVATYDGEAWLGVVAFEMVDVRPRGAPVGLSFPELNLRTYVVPADPDRPSDATTARDRQGVYFFSLDAADRLAVTLARTFFSLPYSLARMDLSRPDGTIRLVSRRVPSSTPEAFFDATYRPDGDASTPDGDSLAAFLAENYRFYTTSDRFSTTGGSIYRGAIAHPPWPLQPASLSIRANALFEANGFEHPGGDPLVHYARSTDVRAGPIRRVRSPDATP